MTSILNSVSGLLLLCGCLGVFGVDKSDKSGKSEFNPEDPMGISCVYDESMTAFHQENISRFSNVSDTLVELLNNGKPLSLYIDGIVSVLKANGSTFRFVKEWSKASNTNVCYLTYAYEKFPPSYFARLAIMRQMVKSLRSQHAARIASDLVFNIRDRCIKTGSFGCWVYMSQLTVVGYSLGAHVASKACNNLYKNTGQKVGKLIGIDPAGIYLTLKGSNQTFINRGDAAYVQIIHTDTLFFGTTLPCGDVDIYVEDIPIGYSQKHSFGPYFHMATSTKSLVLIAAKDKDRPWAHLSGEIMRPDEHLRQKDRAPTEDEIVIGVYSKVDESQRGKQYYFSLKNRIDTMRDSISHVVTMFKPGSCV